MKNPPYAYVMELMSEGDLDKLLFSNKEISWKERLTIVEEITKGIQALHSHHPPVSIGL